MSQQERRAAQCVAHVQVGSVMLECLVVPEPLRLFVGVDVASEPGQHGGVVDDFALLVIHLQTLGKMQSDVGLSKDVFGRVAEP
jgi:hypothetical protein